jgi:hypothetical protein
MKLEEGSAFWTLSMIVQRTALFLLEISAARLLFRSFERNQTKRFFLLVQASARGESNMNH